MKKKEATLFLNRVNQTKRDQSTGRQGAANTSTDDELNRFITSGLLRFGLQSLQERAGWIPPVTGSATNKEAEKLENADAHESSETENFFLTYGILLVEFLEMVPQSENFNQLIQARNDVVSREQREQRKAEVIRKLYASLDVVLAEIWPLLVAAPLDFKSAEDLRNYGEYIHLWRKKYLKVTKIDEVELDIFKVGSAETSRYEKQLRSWEKAWFSRSNTAMLLWRSCQILSQSPEQQHKLERYLEKTKDTYLAFLKEIKGSKRILPSRIREVMLVSAQWLKMAILSPMEIYSPDLLLKSFTEATGFKINTEKFLAYRDWRSSSFFGAFLARANFSFQLMDAVDLKNTSIARTNFSYSFLARTDFSRFQGIYLPPNANILRPEWEEETVFFGADCSGANFSNRDLKKTNFSQANLTNARFENVNFERVDFRGANLTGLYISFQKELSQSIMVDHDTIGPNGQPCQVSGETTFTKAFPDLKQE